jgi:hypothetical protein
MVGLFYRLVERAFSLAPHCQRTLLDESLKNGSCLLGR